MKNFILNIVLFAILATAGMIGFKVLLAAVEKNRADFTLESKPKYVVIGHSHSECAFNDDLIDDFRNISESGESYFYNFIKLKQILKQNPSIEVVFVEFSNNQIKSSMNGWIWDDKYLDYRYPRFSSFMSPSDEFLLLSHNPVGYLNSLSLGLKTTLVRILRRNYDFSNDIGGYLYLKRDKTDSLLKNPPKNTGYFSSDSISSYNLEYLNHIIDFCKEKNIEVYLIRTPLHEKYPGYANESTYRDIYSRMFSNVPFLDFSDYPLENAEFGDLGHLNYKGARIFSTWFDNLLDSGLLDKSDPQKFINQEMQID